MTFNVIGIIIVTLFVLGMIAIFNRVTPTYKSLEHSRKNFIISFIEGLRDFVKIFKS